MNRIRSSVAEVRCGRLTRVCDQQRRTSVLVELVVDREVGEVEERVAHAGVLPVDDPDRGAVVDEVRVEQVVVARHGDDAGSRPPDPQRELVRRAEGLGQRRAALDCGIPVALDHLERVEPAGDRLAAVHRAQRLRYPSERLGLAHPRPPTG